MERGSLDIDNVLYAFCIKVTVLFKITQTIELEIHHCEHILSCYRSYFGTAGKRLRSSRGFFFFFFAVVFTYQGLRLLSTVVRDFLGLGDTQCHYTCPEWLKVHRMSVYNVFVLSIIGVADIGRIWVLWRLLCHFIHVPDHEYFFDDTIDVCSKGENFMVGNPPWE